MINTVAIVLLVLSSVFLIVTVVTAIVWGLAVFWLSWKWNP
jgi:hypothetical protein